MFRRCKVIEEADTGGFPVRNPKPAQSQWEESSGTLKAAPGRLGQVYSGTSVVEQPALNESTSRSPHERYDPTSLANTQ